MRYRAIHILSPLLALLGGCSVLQGGKLFAPETLGFERIAANIYVESGTDEATQSSLRAAMDKAESAIRAAYGSVQARPIAHPPWLFCLAPDAPMV